MKFLGHRITRVWLFLLLASVTAGCATASPTPPPATSTLPPPTNSPAAPPQATVPAPTTTPTQAPSLTPAGTPTPSSIGLTFISRYDPTTNVLTIYGITPGATVVYLGTPLVPVAPPTATPRPTDTATVSPTPTVTRPVVVQPTRTPTVVVSAVGLRGKILFKTDRDGGTYPNTYTYYAMNPDGSDLQKVDTRAADALAAAARNPITGNETREPGGTRTVVGERRCYGGFQSCGLYILDVVLHLTLLNSTDDIGVSPWFQNTNYYAKSPVWSPAGNYIAFVSNHEAPPGCTRTANLFKATPTQKPVVRRMTEFCAGANTDLPTFSPDGSKIAFWSEFPGPRKQIYVINTGATDNEDFRFASPRMIATSSNDWDPLWVK